MSKLAVEEMQIVPIIVPVNLAAGAQSGDWVSLKNYRRATFIFVAGAGAAGQDPVLSFKQATSVSGGSEKALDTIARYDMKQATALASVGTFTKVEQTEDDEVSNTTAGESQNLWVVDIDAADLDINNDFDCVTCNIADPGSSAKLATVLCLLREPRYSQGTMPSAIAN